MTIQERFEEKYIPEPTSGCWLWTGALSVDGYGKVYFESKRSSAHRVSWEIHCGPIRDGLHVLHKCDVPRCVNPDHLFLGTPKDNTQDSIKKGRHFRRMPRQTLEDIIDSEKPIAELADKFGLSEAHVCAIKEGRPYVSTGV